MRDEICRKSGVHRGDGGRTEKRRNRGIDSAFVDLTFPAKDVGERKPTILLSSLATLMLPKWRSISGIEPLRDFEGALGLDEPSIAISLNILTDNALTRLAC